MSSWHDRFTPLEARLVDGFQSGFPVQRRPYRAIAARVDADEQRVHDAVTHLADEGIFRRIGPVLNPPVIGSSALVAMSVPEGDLSTVAETVNAYPEVNHNYSRDHRFNMWFVVTTGARDSREALLADIATETGYEPLFLPMRTQYYISLEFPVVNDEPVARSETGRAPAEPVRIADEPIELSTFERRLLLEIQDGFGLIRRPYEELAATLDVDVSTVLSAIEDLTASRAIKRIGCVVNHRAVGFDANCMVAWDVPPDRLDEAGRAAGAHPSVTYCCERVRKEDDGWPYNLFTMIHGRSRDAVETVIDELAAERLPGTHARLPTRNALKQTGARYSDLVAADREQLPS